MSTHTAPPPRPLSRVWVVLRNTASILANDLVNRASSFAIYILVGRFLGEFAFGQMQLALSYYFLMQSLASMGLRTYITRELAKDPEDTDRLLVNGSVLVLITAGIAWVGLFLLTRIFGYGEETATVVLIMGLTILPYTQMMVTEGVFIGRERMHFIIAVNAPFNILNIVLTFLVLQAGLGVYAVASVSLVCYLAIIIIERILMRRYVTRGQRRPSLPDMRRILKGTSAFFGVEAVIGLSVALQSIVLSVVRTEREVGLLGSASQLFGPISMLMGGIVTSLLPTLTRQAQGSLEIMKKSGTHLIEFLLLISVPSVVGIIFIADRLLVFIYGRESFALAGVLLSIFCIALINRSFVHVLGNMLYATGHERENLRIVTIRSVLFLIASVLAIVQFGEIGAVITSLALDFIDLGMHYEAVNRRLHFIVNPLPIIWRPALAAAVMGVALYLLPDGHVLIDIVVGGAVYALSIGIILYLSIGGPRKLKDRYLGRPAETAPVTESSRLALAEGD